MCGGVPPRPSSQAGTQSGSFAIPISPWRNLVAPEMVTKMARLVPCL